MKKTRFLNASKPKLVRMILISTIFYLAAIACQVGSALPATASPSPRPVLTPARLDPVIAPTQAVKPMDETWLEWKSANPGFSLRYPPDWRAVSTRDGEIQLYPPTSNPDVPSPGIQFEWLAVNFTPGQPLVSTYTNLAPIMIAGVAGQAYQDSQLATPLQSVYIELPYAKGVIFISASIGPGINLSPYLSQILSTFTLINANQ